MSPSDGELTALFIRAERVAARIVGSSVSEEIAAEVVIRAVRSWRRVRTHPDAWVARTATNLAIDALRRRRREERTGLPIEAVTSFEDGVANRELARTVMAALPRRQQQVFALHYLVGLPDREVAETLGVSVATVRTHLLRGRRALRALFRDPQLEVDR